MYVLKLGLIIQTKLGRFFHERSWIESERNGTERYWNHLTVLGYIVYRLSTVRNRSFSNGPNLGSFIFTANGHQQYTNGKNRSYTVRIVHVPFLIVHIPFLIVHIPFLIVN